MDHSVAPTTDKWDVLSSPASGGEDNRVGIRD